MDSSRLLRPMTPTPTPGPRSAARGLSSDLLNEGARRLSWAAFLYSLAFSLAFLPGYISHRIINPELMAEYSQFPVYTSFVAMGLGLLVALVARKGWICAESLLPVGLVFEVVGAFGIGISTNWWWFEQLAKGEKIVPTGISWICVWILMFALVLPVRPRWTFLAALATAAMDPLTQYISWVGHGRLALPFEVRTHDMILSISPPFITAVIALFAARVVYKMGRDITRAKELGSYRLVRLLGQGGMGEVWLGKHRLLARPAAIKLIRPDKLGSKTGQEALVTLRRFEREAQATAALESPHTIQLYDFGITDEQVFYYVMELLNGLDLETLVARFGPMPAERVVHMLTQACHSLQDAHGRGLIHRDIKPANLFACHIGPDYDFLKVLDFGLVKYEAELRKGDTGLTLEGIASGTPAYMPPEVALGRKEIDERLDIYSLGCVAYWMLTGQRVFDGGTPMEVVVRHVQEAPPPPSKRTEIPIPPDVEEIILSCLEKDPAGRPAGAAELAARLRASSVAGMWTEEKAMRWWEAHMPARKAPDAGEAGGTEVPAPDSGREP